MSMSGSFVLPGEILFALKLNGREWQYLDLFRSAIGNGYFSNHHWIFAACLAC